MNRAYREIDAELFSRMPNSLHHQGEPSNWAKMTRPDEAMHSFLEGLEIDEFGTFWLVDVPYGRIFNIDPNGNWTTRFTYKGEPHSIQKVASCEYLIPDYSLGLLSYNSRNNEIIPVSNKKNYGPIHGLSDIALGNDGTIWLTDSGRSSLSDPCGQLLRKSPGGPLECVLAKLPYPNGVVVSPDNKTVYVALTRDNAIWKLNTSDLETPPMAGRYIQLSGGLGPDGLAISSDNYLAVAQARAGRAYIFDPLGDPVIRINTPHGVSTTSVTFDQNDNLYIVEAQSASIYIVPKTRWAS
ncbi:MAG: SMP-30/gluconolactonase/LRE family protein [Cohaesibacteraceae bacterium]|nr:SMP-30/gluconolactonase/LRE family protein [Cohaesibacteraceae bacterium]